MDFLIFNHLKQRAYKHGVKLFYSVRMHIDVAEEAKDHASEVVLRFFNAYFVEGAAIEEQPIALLYVISKNRFLDWIRAQERLSRKKKAYNRERETDTAWHRDPDNEISQLLDRAMAQLPAREFIVMSLTRKGKTEKQIVEETGLTKNQVKYAKKKASKILKSDAGLTEYMEI